VRCELEVLGVGARGEEADGEGHARWGVGCFESSTERRYCLGESCFRGNERVYGESLRDAS